VTIENENKDIVRSYVAAFNGGDSTRLRELFTDDAVVQGVLGWADVAQAIEIWRQLHDAFAIQLQVDALIAEGDFVAAKYAERGTFRAAFRGRPPTGKSYELVAMEWFELRDGKICHRWGARDSAAQARQIGLKAE
jgi:steroid delta-isomerase-like uncharacterized protein